MKTIERRGAISVPYTRMYPKITGGICDFCGVIDRTQPSTVQYQLCPHFKGTGELRCSYCDATKSPEDVIYHGILKVHEHPNDPNTLIVVCNSYTCEKAHNERFQLNRT